MNGNGHKGIDFKIRTQKGTYKMVVVMFEKYICTLILTVNVEWHRYAY